MCPTAVQTAAFAITNGHSVNVAVSFQTATNTVYISSHFSYVFPVISIILNLSGNIKTIWEGYLAFYHSMILYFILSIATVAN